MFTTYAMPFLDALWRMSLQLAPWLLLGLLVAGLIRALAPISWVAKVLGKGGVMSTVWAALLGAPLPLCSCSVLPVAIGLRRQGASKPATAAFLISTPENGVDSMAVTYAMLGPFMTIVRPIAALFAAIAAGLAVSVATRHESDDAHQDNHEHKHGHSCCSHEASEPAQPAKKSCCSSTATEPAPAKKSCCSSDSCSNETGEAGSGASGGGGSGGLGKRVLDGMIFAVTTLFGDLLKWLVLGLLIAAAVEAYVLPTGFLETWGQGPLAMVVMLVIGIPMYICATSSTPLGAALLAAGVSPGAVLVLLLAGPATNVSTFGVLRQELGTRAAVTSMSTLAVAALLCGWLTDLAVGWFHINIASQVSHAHDTMTLWIALPALIVLVILAVYSQLRRRSQPTHEHHHHAATPAAPAD